MNCLSAGVLLVCGITIMIALLLTLAGLLRKKAAAWSFPGIGFRALKGDVG